MKNLTVVLFLVMVASVSQPARADQVTDDGLPKDSYFLSFSYNSFCSNQWSDKSCSFSSVQIVDRFSLNSAVSDIDRRLNELEAKNTLLETQNEELRNEVQALTKGLEEREKEQHSK